MDEITHAYYQGVQDYIDSANAMAAYNVSPEMIAYYQGINDYNDAISAAAAESYPPEVVEYYQGLAEYYQGLSDYQSALEDAAQQEADYYTALQAAAEQDAAQQGQNAEAYMQGWQDCVGTCMASAEMNARAEAGL